MEALVHGMYGSDYPVDGEFAGGGEASPLLFHTAVFALATQYVAPAVQRLAAKNFEAFATNQWNERCFSVFPMAVQQIYETTHSHERGLRDAAVRVAANNASVLFDVDNGFKGVVLEVREFASDLAQQIARRGTWVTSFICPGCRESWSGHTFGRGKGICGRCGVFRNDWHKHVDQGQSW